MSDYKKSETRQILEEIYSGKYPVRGSDGREYYVRYNDNREELEEVPPPELRPLTEKDKAKALRLASGLRPQGIGAWKIAGEGLKGFGQGVVSGLGRVAGGATLGATTGWTGRLAVIWRRLMRICSARRKVPVWAAGIKRQNLLLS